MDTEETIALQLASSQFSCREADKIIAKYKQARTNKERAKIFPIMKSIAGRLQLESHFISEMIENECGGADNEEADRGF